MKNHEKIIAKICLGLPLTEREQAIYLLFIASEEENEEMGV